MVADYRREATRVRNDFVWAIPSLMRPAEGTVAQMVQATAYGRANNELFLRVFLVFMARAFSLGRLRTFDEVMMVKWQEGEGAKTDRHRYEL
jgi:hypothetical protein